MALIGKLVSELEIHSNANKFYNFFKHQIFHIPSLSPKLIQKVKVHEEDWNTHAHVSTKIWIYTIDGKAEVFKERVEFDDKKLVMTLVGLEGGVFKHYKTFKLTYQIVPKEPERSLVILILEYEKLDDGSTYPYKYTDLLSNIIKDIESHLK
ncbi:MLP-like protein 329 [Benincasa hispida]|uniref:MLP-like protein 329 n=1 Tax=Benincasa hispida TaxID=102211 RepID=UPI0018FF28F5|nr:MLP-like protein 329 [Benincasa hispida]